MFPYFFLIFISSGWIASILKNPFYAVIIYVFVYFNIPAFQWWGYAVPNLRYSMLAIFMLFLSYYFNRGRIKFRFVSNDRSFQMLVALSILMLFITPFAVSPAASWNRSIQFIKYLIAYFFIVKIITEDYQYKAVLYTFVLCFFYLGYVGRYYFTGQRLDGVGVIDASDANLLAAFLVMIIPFLVINLFFGKKLDRFIILISSPFILNLFLLTRSRGGFIGVVFSFVSMLFLYKKVTNKIKILVPLSIFIFTLIYLSDQSFVDRVINFLSSDNITGQSSGRFESWNYGIRILFDYPFGVGGEGFALLSPKYLPEHLLEQSLGIRVAHNTYIQVLIEQGYIGLLLFLLFIFFLMRKLHMMRKLLEMRADSEDNKYLINQSYALESGLIGFFCAAFFVDRLYFEGLYLFSALASILYNISIDRISNLPENTGAPQGA